MPPYEGNSFQAAIYSRFQFNSRTQGATENLDDFLAELGKLSTSCDYQGSEKFVEELVRDRLIVGVKNKEVQAKLLTYEQELTLEKAVEIARSFEVAKIKTERQDDEEMPAASASATTTTDEQDKSESTAGEDVKGGDVAEATASTSSSSKPDIKVSEETKIAIVIELLNHKQLLTVPIGNELEKAQLWEKVFNFAESTGAPFKSALHLRETFGSWKAAALQARDGGEEDVKASSSDKLIWDLFGQDASAAEDYPILNNVEPILEEVGEEDDYYQPDEDIGAGAASGSDTTAYSEEEYSEEEDKPYKPPPVKKKKERNERFFDDSYDGFPAKKRGPGRPRKSDSAAAPAPAGSVTNEIKHSILRRFVQHRKIVACVGMEKEKKEVFRNVYNEFQGQLANVTNPSEFRNVFRQWKMRSMRKQRTNDILSESDRLIFRIFDIEYDEHDRGRHPSDPSVPTNNDVADDDSDASGEEGANLPNKNFDNTKNYCFIDTPFKVDVLQEMAKHRRVIGMDEGSVYDKENAWREIYTKIETTGVTNLTLRKLKALIKSWKVKAFQASVKQGGPITPMQRLFYCIYNIDKNSAVPLAGLNDVS